MSKSKWKFFHDFEPFSKNRNIFDVVWICCSIISLAYDSNLQIFKLNLTDDKKVLHSIQLHMNKCSHLIPRGGEGFLTRHIV